MGNCAGTHRDTSESLDVGLTLTLTPIGVLTATTSPIDAASRTPTSNPNPNPNPNPATQTLPQPRPQPYPDPNPTPTPTLPQPQPKTPTLTLTLTLTLGVGLGLLTAGRVAGQLEQTVSVRGALHLSALHHQSHEVPLKVWVLARHGRRHLPLPAPRQLAQRRLVVHAPHLGQG